MSFSEPAGKSLPPGTRQNLSLDQIKFIESVKENVVILNEKPPDPEKISRIFEASTSLLTGLSVDTDTQLNMYALYKQIKVGDCTGKQPGYFDFVGQKKYAAWKKVKGMPKGDAMIAYINLVLGRLGPIQQGLVDKMKEAQGFGMGIQSQMVKGKDHNKVFSDLFGIVEAGDLEALSEAVKSGADIFERNDMQETLLHFAADRGHASLCEFLLKENSELVSLKDDMGFTPLHSAAISGKAEIAALLMEYGADKRAESLDGETPFDLAEGMIRHLLEP